MVIYPEDYFFLEQVNLFRNAEYIAGPGGAVFTNIIFCKPKTKILGIISEQKKEFCLHSNLASLAECEFIYLTSKTHITKNQFFNLSSYYHSPFKADLKKIKRYFKSERI